MTVLLSLIMTAAGVAFGLAFEARGGRIRHNREIEALAQRSARLNARAYSDGHFAAQAKARREHLADLERIRAIGDEA